MLAQLRPALFVTLFFTALLGIGYPLAITGIAQLAFPAQAGGSVIQSASGQVIGSRLLAQGFARPEYLHPRPSAAGSNGWDPTSSSGSNLGPLNPDLIKRVAKDTAALARENGAKVVPADAVTTSGSGLDPDVSPANAQMQAARVATARGAALSDVEALVAAHVQGPALGVFGQRRVNVLETNLALDARWPLPRRPGT